MTHSEHKKYSLNIPVGQLQDVPNSYRTWGSHIMENTSSGRTTVRWPAGDPVPGAAQYWKVLTL